MINYLDLSLNQRINYKGNLAFSGLLRNPFGTWRDGIVLRDVSTSDGWVNESYGQSRNVKRGQISGFRGPQKRYPN